MAVKDHSLDSKIIESAKSEFLKYGYSGASLHKIADNAGITTGALYTRYKNKDELFSSLCESAIERIKGNINPIANLYKDVYESRDAEKLLTVIKKESEFYIDILFEYYDECVLFFCKSTGSSIDAKLKELMALKAHQTAQFINAFSKNGKEIEGIELIIEEQFHCYRGILEKGYSKEKAVACMNTFSEFSQAGWKQLFSKIM